MKDAPNWDSQELTKKLQEITTVIQDLAQQQQYNCQGLLLLLRTIEHLHRDIREQLFEPSLPNTRKDVYNLLREIEESGGWPYIERMRLKALMVHLLSVEGGQPSGFGSSDSTGTAKTPTASPQAPPFKGGERLTQSTDSLSPSRSDSEKTES